MTNTAAENPRELQQRLHDAVKDFPRFAAGPGPAADPVAEALCQIARHHRLSADPQSIAAGLPLVAGFLPVEGLEAAADRAGLEVEEIAARPGAIDKTLCPALAITADGEVRIVASIGADGHLVLTSLTSGEPKRRVARAEIEATIKRLFVLRPASADDRKHDDGTAGLLSRRLIRKNAGLYGEALLATVAINLIGLVIPLFTMNVYDRVLPNNSVSTLIALSVGVALAGLFDFVLKALRGLLIDIASRRSDLTISMKVFARMLGAKLKPVNASVGVQANTLREIETIREFNTSVTLAALGDLPFALLFLVVIALVGGELVLVPIIAMPIIIGLIIALQLPIDRMTEASFKHMANKSGVLIETLTGLETLKGVGAESWAATRWEKAVADQLRMGTMMRFLGGLGMGLVSLGSIGSTIAMIVYGVFLVADGKITAGALMASMMLMSRAMQPVAQVAALSGKLHSVKLAHKSLKGVLEAPQERSLDTAMISPAEVRGAIQFEGVSLSFVEGAPPALANIDFKISAGERVGVLGAIGSGKTSLIKLIAKIHEPSNGRILIDDLALSSIDPTALRARIGYLGQDAMLFQGSIRENLNLHRPHATDQDLIAAAEQSGALLWISRLPQGFDTRLGERGAGLSGGQKRSLALARALVGEPELLLLDEPTSEMDGRSEQLVIEKVKRILPGKTLLLVTHRPATLDLVDRLIVLDQGRIVANGPKAQVLAELQRQATQVAAAPRLQGVV